MAPRRPRLDFEGLYRLHHAEVYRVALRKLGDHHEAEDVTQTTFLDAYRAVLRGSEPELPRAWLHAIAENVRRRRFRRSSVQPREEQLQETFAAHQAAVTANEIRAALATLADGQRKAFLLRELGGLSYTEIAQELELSVPSVQMLLFRARQKLRSELGRSGAGRLGGLLPLPQLQQWLGSIADRLLPAASGPARIAGLAAAGAVAVGGGVTADAPLPPEARAEPPAPAPAERATTAASPQQGPTVTLRAAAITRVAAPSGSASAPLAQLSPRASAARPHGIRAAPAPAVPPAAAPALQPGAEPAAPLVPPATPEVDGGAPAPALVPAVPPVAEATTAPVQLPPSAPVPELPVEESVPALVGSAVGEPPLPPLPPLPGGPGVTTPEIPVPAPVLPPLP